MIKAIIFDLGGVIVEDRATNFFENKKRLFTVEKWEEFSVLNSQADKGFMDKEEYLRVVDHFFGSGEGKRLLLVQKGCFSFPDEEVLALIRKLKGKYKIGLISNLYSFWVREVRKENYLNLFDSIIFSSEVGLEKPDAQVYLLSAKDLGVLPQECIFIDDKQVNVDGAIIAGMIGIRFMNIKDLVDKLADFGIIGND